jgi:signal transduction histidine kinase/DNA-binding response OmpR family regulator/ligand-binding sensor domain-containing protein
MPRHLITIKTLLAITAFCMGITAVAQKPAAYEGISIAQGLSQGMVFDILQDKEGFIWVATKNGLNRYDGYTFKVFTNDPYNEHTLSSNTIIKLFEDSKGRIWAGTENAGVNIYDKKTGIFYRIVHNPSNETSLSGNEIKTMEEMPDGSMLIGADAAGLNRVTLTNNFFTKNAAPVITRLVLPNNTQVYGMGKDKNGTIWVGGMDETVYQFDPLKNSFIQLPGGRLYNNGYLNPDKSIFINNGLFLWDGKTAQPLFDTQKMPEGTIIFNPNDILWDNHHRELHFYNVSKWQKGATPNWNEPLPVDTAIRICYPFIIDRSGILWTGSVGYGLRKYNIASSKFKLQLPGYSVRFIVPAAASDIFIGDYSYRWLRINNDVTVTNQFSNIKQVTQIDNFIISAKGDYWIKSDNKGYFKYNPSLGKLTAYPQINFYAGQGDKQPMLQDNKGNILFPGLGGVIHYINTNTNKPDSFTINTDAAKPMPAKAICTALYQDKQGVFWIGTQDGFAKVVFGNDDKKVPQVRWYYNSNSTRNSLNYNHVSSFMDDPAAPNKYLWIGTKGGGLNRLDKTTGDFFHLTNKDGLPDDVVYGVLPDDAGNIWGSTNKGIFCLTPSEKNKGNSWVFRNFTKADGLQDDEFNTGAYAKLPNGEMAFGGVNGLSIFNPQKILEADFTPNVFITNILVGNQPVVPNDKTGVLQQNIEQATAITLNRLQDILTLEFSALDFTVPAQNKYRYQLVGIDKDWVESGTRRTATYLHLPSGKYIFKVQGTNSQGIWSNKIAELQITVLPPWWRSWWAYLIYTVLIGLGIRAYFKFTVNRAKLKSQLNFEQLEAKRIKELDAVKTQLYTNITHEFRTPLTVILGMAQQVKSNPQEHLENGVNMIIRNGQSLLNLVNEMLDLSKLETGKMQLQLVNGDVINFLRYIVESFHSLAESQKKQLHFLAEIDALYMAYDPEKIRQIVANLLSNALKFTPEKGNIYISVSENNLQYSEDASTIIIKVKDTGIGIPEGQLQHIFDRFYQLDNSHTRKAEGTGIGLALTKELVKLMEGEITVKSPPTGANRGTEFTVTLPLKKIAATLNNIDFINTEEANTKKVNAVTTTAFEHADAHPGKPKPLILLVEDNADVVAYTASCLPDYRLAVGKDGREGFEIAAEIIPDLIITDVMMPFVDGFELCRQLRHNEYTSHIPIIMLTAKADIESKMEGLKKGADAYLEKPFNREELLIRIEKLLELRQNLQQYYLKKAGLNNSALLLAAENTVTDTEIENEFVKRVREAIEQHITETNFTVEQLCKLVFMSHSQLHRKLDALTGCSPNKFIRIIRLNKAKELLKKPTESIASIALDCGYSDPGYFARVFKQECGVTPQEWRGSN